MFLLRSFFIICINGLVLATLASAQSVIQSRAMFKTGDFTGDRSSDVVILRSLFNAQRQTYTLEEIQFVEGRSLGVVASIIPATRGLRQPRAFRLGDVNGDGLADIAITSEASSRRRADKLFLYSGTGQLIRKQRLAKKGIVTSVLDITRLGDVDRDGIEDFAVGATQNRPEKRTLTMYSGLTGRKLKKLKNSAQSQFAQSLATIGDRNFDGLPDILVGGVPRGNPKGGAYSILSGADLSLLHQEAATSPDLLLGDDVHEGVDLNGDLVPEYAVSLLVKSVANHTMRVYDGRSGRLMYGIAIAGGFGSNLALQTRLNSRVMDWISDIDFDCIPEAVVVGDDAQVRLFSGANGRFIRTITSASSFATLTRPAKPYSWFLATSGFSGQRVLDVRTLFHDDLRPFCDG